MSDKKEMIDRLLERQIDNPSPYEGLIPVADGKRIAFESPAEYSDTFDTLSYMGRWSERFYLQMQKIAPLLAGNNRQQTAANIFNFLYRNFQYSLDGELQQLYNPASAWKNRFSGIDCKSYSILASTILLNLGIPHAFRMVKQRGVRSGNDWVIDPEAWTHVYVIVFSEDRKREYVIDATTHDNIEVSFTKKYDLIMKNLKHVGLSSPMPIGMGCGCGGQKGQLGISIGDITGMVGSLSCIGGTAYKAEYLTRNLTVMNSKFAAIVQKINQAVSASDMAGLSSSAAEFKLIANLMHTTYVRKKASKDWNSCSRKNFDATIKAVTFFKDKCGPALDAWLNEYYVKGSQTSSLSITNEGWEDGFSTNTGLWGMKLTPWITVTEPKYSLTIKNYVRQVPAFAINEYLVAIEKSGAAFNWGTFLQGLTAIAGSFQVPGNTGGTGTGNGSGTGPGSGSVQGEGTGSGNTPDTGMSSTTKALLGFGGAAALAFVFFQPSDSPKSLERQYYKTNSPARRRPASKSKKR